MIIDQLPALVTAGDNDEIAIEVGTTTYKIKKSDFLKEFMPKSGGEFTGDVAVGGVLDVIPRRCYATLSSQGWYRVLAYNGNNDGGPRGNPSFIIPLKITKSSTAVGSETHEITLSVRWDGASGGARFFDENSSTYSALVVDKIRYTRNGANAYIDIHFNLNSANVIHVNFDVFCDYSLQSKFVSQSFQSVDPSPDGEEVLAEYTFTTITGMRVVNAQSSTSFGDAIATIKDIIGDRYITYGGNAANNLHAGISNFSNGVVSVDSSGGPIFFATLGKYSGTYYVAELFTYSYPWRLRIRNANGTYHAELYYPNY